LDRIRSHPRERFFVRLGTGSTGSETGEMTEADIRKQTERVSGKRSGDRGGRWIEDEPHRQDNGFS